MPKPTNVSGVRRIIGFVTYLSKFLPKFSDICEPLRKLTLMDSELLDNHDNALDEIKRLVTAKPVLKYYDPKLQLVLQSDASETGLGATIIQEYQPIAYASRALTNTETKICPNREGTALLYLDSKGFTNIHMEEQFK